MAYVNNNICLIIAKKTFSILQAIVYGSSTSQHHAVEVAFPVSYKKARGLHTTRSNITTNS
jgi:hypothetical protein